MTVRTIAPGILEIEAPAGENRLALYLLHAERSLLVDSGLREAPETVIFPALAQAGLSSTIDMLLVSHADADHHGGNAAILDRSPTTTILCHRLDLPRVTSKEYHIRTRYIDAVRADDTPYGPELLAWLDDQIGPDRPVHLALSGGELIRLGPDQVWEVFHTPGHTPGHLSLWNAREGILIIQDAVFGRGVPDATGKIGSPPPYFDVAEYFASIQELRSLDANLLLLAHFPPIEGAAAIQQFFDDSAAFAADLHGLVYEIVASAAEPLTLGQVCNLVDQRLGPYATPIQWIPPVRGHLERLTTTGQLRELRDTGPRTWSARRPL
jgi:glyoxylase-like metal-dependent hydrolase (beta-lactamase superfamily II)